MSANYKFADVVMLSDILQNNPEKLKTICVDQIIDAMLGEAMFSTDDEELEKEARTLAKSVFAKMPDTPEFLQIWYAGQLAAIVGFIILKRSREAVLKAEEKKIIEATKQRISRVFESQSNKKRVSIGFFYFVNWETLQALEKEGFLKICSFPMINDIYLELNAQL